MGHLDFKEKVSIIVTARCRHAENQMERLKCFSKQFTGNKKMRDEGDVEIQLMCDSSMDRMKGDALRSGRRDATKPGRKISKTVRQRYYQDETPLRISSEEENVRAQQNGLPQSAVILQLTQRDQYKKEKQGPVKGRQLVQLYKLFWKFY